MFWGLMTCLGVLLFGGPFWVHVFGVVGIFDAGVWGHLLGWVWGCVPPWSVLGSCSLMVICRSRIFFWGFVR